MKPIPLSDLARILGGSNAAKDDDAKLASDRATGKEAPTTGVKSGIVDITHLYIGKGLIIAGAKPEKP